MSLKETIMRDLQSAMKKGDTVRLSTLRTIKAALLEKEIALRGTTSSVTPDDEVAVLLSAAKRRKESIELFRTGNRNAEAELEQKELDIIQEYLPKPVTPADIEVIVARVIQETSASSAKDFGKVMPAVMKELKGKADGKLVQEIVKRQLGG